MNVAQWLKSNTNSLKGKTVAVTGSTGGIGKELCRYIAMLGGNLILLDRSFERSNAHRKELLEQNPDISVRCITLDLSVFASIKIVAEQLTTLEFDFFIHNAGAYSIPRNKTDIGFDNVFQINFVAPYYIIRKLLENGFGGRVVVVGSIAHNYSKIDPLDIDFSNRKAASKVYGNAKRFLMFALYELFEQKQKATLSVTHPGITFTNITAHYPKAIFWLIKEPMKLIFMSVKKAALSVLLGLFRETRHSEWLGPRIFNVWGLPRLVILKTVSKKESEKIGEIAQEIYLRINK